MINLMVIFAIVSLFDDIVFEIDYSINTAVYVKPPPLLRAIRRIDNCLKTIFPKCRSPPIHPLY